jgi:hypothetical protein
VDRPCHQGNEGKGKIKTKGNKETSKPKSKKGIKNGRHSERKTERKSIQLEGSREQRAPD